MDLVERDRLVNFYFAFPAPSRPNAYSVAVHRSRGLVSYCRAFRLAHTAARARVLALIASRSHAEPVTDPDVSAPLGSTDRDLGGPAPSLPEVDVKALVAAPSAPPRPLAQHSSEAST